MEGELQRLERKKQRDMGGASKGFTAGRRDAEMDQLAKQVDKVQQKEHGSLYLELNHFVFSHSIVGCNTVCACMHTL